MLDFIPCVSIAPDYFVQYQKIEGLNSSSRNTTGLARREHDGFISQSGAKRLRLAVDWLFYLTFDKTKINYKKKTKKQFRLTFVTLTLPSQQQHSDKEIKSKLLNQFLIEAKKKWFIEHYVWRAEKQKNGNIHFHIITDRYINHVDLRKVWNRITQKLNYVAVYQNKMLQSYKNGINRRDFKDYATFNVALKRYKKGKAGNWSNPNSTDIHGIETIKNLKAYISKYMSKSEGEQEKLESAKVSGRIWFISLALSKIKKAQTEIYSKISSELSKLRENVPEKISFLEHCTIYKIKATELLENGCKELFSIFSDYFLKWQNVLYT